MARRTNFKFEKMERDRQKAEKKQKRLEAKQERAALRKAGGADAPASDTRET